MNYKMVGRFLAQILTVEGLFMIPAVIIGYVCGEDNAMQALLWSILIIVVVVAFLRLTCRHAASGFYAKEGLACVGLGWIGMSLFGGLPFFIAREIPNYVDALFEIVSGFTTTGSSILPAVEDMSQCLLYWRSFSHWLGGMGVLVFLLAIVPAGGKGRGYTMHILRAESPGPVVGKLVPKMKDTAKILYLIYILLTVINIIFLLAGHMPAFDAFCTAFGTAGTGGFGIKNDSIAGYSPYLQNVTTVFMLLFGVNFSCYYLLLIRQFKAVFFDEELRLYLGAVLGSTALIVWNLRGFYGSLGETIRHAAFQVSSIITTTGFATTDFDKWPGFSKAIILSLMVLGACAGSTGGGLKCGRALILLKSAHRNIRKVLHPQKVQVVRNNGRMVDEKIVASINAYMAIYVIIVILSFLMISIDGFSVETNLSAVLACFNNIGPGLDAVGPTCNFSAYSIFSKLVLIGDMLAGRLEIFPILILLSRSAWSQR